MNIIFAVGINKMFDKNVRDRARISKSVYIKYALQKSYNERYVISGI